jgi:nitrite reductase/ring-hydroxylating ferredoxin subunit
MERELEMEREGSNYILVAALSHLNASKGKYFVDYEMQPDLAFLGANGLPLLLSAKCTHLGCTVGNNVNDHGQILCPSHISYFDIKTGQPNHGSPAKAPLPHIGWVLKGGETVSSSLNFYPSCIQLLTGSNSNRLGERFHLNKEKTK